MGGTTHMATDMPYLLSTMVIISSERDLLMLNQRANHTTVTMAVMDIHTRDTDTLITLERDLLMLNQRANHTTVMVVYTVGDMDTVDTDTATVDTPMENRLTEPNYVYIQLLKGLV